MKLKGVKFTIKEKWLHWDDKFVFRSNKFHYPSSKEEYVEILKTYLTSYGAIVWRLPPTEDELYLYMDHHNWDYSIEEWIQMRIEDGFPMYE